MILKDLELSIKRGKEGRLRGEAGNLRVASELLLRGLNVMFPALDDGVDMFVEGGVRVQVKTARVQRHQGGRSYYMFNLARGPQRPNRGKEKKAHTRMFSKVCDFLVLWGIEEDRFWIVPAGLLDGRWNIGLGRGMYWHDVSISRIKELANSGMTCGQIAEVIRTSPMTVSRRLRGQFLEPPEVNAKLQEIKLCEGRWDLIESYVSTLAQAEAASLVDVEHVET